MKKKLFYIVFSAIFCGDLKGQNLVPNFSFEDTIQCVQHDDQFTGYVANWSGQGGGGGLCYFTSHCSGLGYDVGVPYNDCGFQYAHTGVSYAGVYTYISDTTKIAPYDSIMHNARNYIQVRLISSLLAGKRYYVAFYVNLSDSMNFICNDMGAFFSVDSVPMNNTTEGRVIDSIPQVANNPVKNPLNDTLHWTKIAGGFIAKGGEKYVTIGNFKNDTISNIKYQGVISPAGNASFYYIDDVIVSSDSNYADSLFSVGINGLQPNKVNVNVYPNPSNGVFTFQMQGSNEKVQIDIYSILGEQVYNKKIISESTQIDLSNQPKGLYLYRITSEKGELTGTGKLVIQ